MKNFKILKSAVIGLVIAGSFSANAFYENKFYQIRDIKKSVLCDAISTMGKSTLKLCQMSSIMYWQKCVDANIRAKYGLGLCDNKKKMKEALNDKIEYVFEDYAKHKDDIGPASVYDDDAEAKQKDDAQQGWEIY